MEGEVLGRLLSPPRERERIFGVVVGIVTNTQDPDGLGRVKVRFPWLSEDDESVWARVLTPMAGKSRGLFLPPEIDDEVLVAFEHGRAEFPYVLGGLWNGRDKPPEDNSDGKNDRRTLRSRSGSIVRLDDTPGGEKIEIVDKSGKNSLVISTADNSIAIAADGDVKITSTRGKLTLSAASVEIDAQSGVKIEAGSTLDVSARGPLTVKGTTVDIN